MAAFHALREGGAAAGTQPQRSGISLAALSDVYDSSTRKTTGKCGNFSEFPLVEKGAGPRTALARNLGWSRRSGSRLWHMSSSIESSGIQNSWSDFVEKPLNQPLNWFRRCDSLV
jgi:hypothetical protein